MIDLCWGLWSLRRHIDAALLVLQQVNIFSIKQLTLWAMCSTTNKYKRMLAAATLSGISPRLRTQKMPPNLYHRSVGSFHIYNFFFCTVRAVKISPKQNIRHFVTEKVCYVLGIIFQYTNFSHFFVVSSSVPDVVVLFPPIVYGIWIITINMFIQLD